MSRDESCQTNVVCGTTLCANDFYEDQGRIDGIFCDFTNEDKLSFLHECKEKGIRNMEMESLCFSAYLKRANIKCEF